MGVLRGLHGCVVRNTWVCCIGFHTSFYYPQDSSKSKEVLQFIDGQSKSSFPAAATKTLGRSVDHLTAYLRISSCVCD